jgi:SOS-response transcriptional repressor LexA
MKNIGGRLKFFRQKLGLSQLELSQKSNISQASIARIEAHQQKNLRTRTVEKLAAALEVSLSHLLEEPLMVKEEVSSYMIPKMIPVMTVEQFITLKRSDNVKERVNYIEPSFSHDQNAFFIKVTGALISRPLINEADLLLIEPDAEVKDGDIVLLISNDRNSIGRLFYRPPIHILQPLKEESEPISFTKKEIKQRGVRIFRIGEIRRKY